MRDTGSPSWVEEMRVKRALWFIQLVGDINRLAMKDDNLLGWSREDVERIRSVEPEELAENTRVPRCVAAVEEVRAVTRYLQELEEGSAEESRFYRLPRPPAGASSVAWTTQQPEAWFLTYGDIGFAYDYGKGRVEIEPTPEVRQHYPCPQCSEDQLWGRTRISLASQAPGTAFFVSLIRGTYNSPLPGVRFDASRYLGFGIWDQKRMHFLGLLDEVQPPYQVAEFFFFAWKSLLSTEEITSVKEAARENQRRQRNVLR